MLINMKEKDFAQTLNHACSQAASPASELSITGQTHTLIFFNRHQPVWYKDARVACIPCQELQDTNVTDDPLSGLRNRVTKQVLKHLLIVTQVIAMLNGISVNISISINPGVVILQQVTSVLISMSTVLAKWSTEYYYQR